MKLREAEANLSLKEMKARVQDLEETWDRHQEKQREWESNGKVRLLGKREFTGNESWHKY